MGFEMIRPGKFKGSIPTVSVVANTFRSGGIDITLAGMRDQLYDKNRFEVILVDHRYEYRHKEVVALAKAYGIQNFTHVPEYQRNGKWVSFCSGWNTGFALSDGEITLTLCDYSYAPPQWINKHVAWHYDTTGRKLKRLAIGPHSVHTMPLPFLFHGNESDYQAWIKNQALHSGNNSVTGGCIDQPDFGKVFGEISIFPELFDPIEVNRTFTAQPPNQDPKLIYETGRCKREWMHVKNESCFTESIYEINGLDELFEYGKGPMDNEFGARFEYSGHELIFDRDNAIFCFDPRFLMSSMPWGDWHKNVEGRWAYFQGESYQNQRYNEFANGAKPWAPNPYSLREKRKDLLPWKKLEQITPDMIQTKPPCSYYPPFGVKASTNRNIPAPITPDAILRRFIGQFVTFGDTVIDVGACVGEYTEVLADLVGYGGLVVAIEPGIKTYEKLCEDFGKYKNVSLYRKAISNKAGHERLAHHKYWILLPEVPTEPYSEPDIPLKEEALIDVDIVTLDDIYYGLSERYQARLSFIKIDVDGWEVKVLEGAEDVLSRVRPIILIEISRYCIEKVGDKFEKAFEILWKHNYDVIAAPNLGIPELKEPRLIHDIAEVVNLLDYEGVIGLDFICKPRANISGIPLASKKYWERCIYGEGFEGPTEWAGSGFRSGDFLADSSESLRKRLTSVWVQRNEVPTGEEFYLELSAMDLKGLKILDFGSGSGIDALHMTQRGACVTACDIVPNNILFESKVLEGTTSRAVLLENYDDISKLGLFDMVYSNGVLQNIQPDKMAYVIAQLKKVLKPNGVFLCMVYTDVYYPHKNAHFEGPYVRGFSIDQLTELLGMKRESYRIFNQKTYMWGLFRNETK